MLLKMNNLKSKSPLHSITTHLQSIIIRKESRKNSKKEELFALYPHSHKQQSQMKLK